MSVLILSLVYFRRYRRAADPVPDIAHTAELVQEISTASAEQSIGIGQISKAVENLNKVIQPNAAAANRLSEAVTRLRHDASGLDVSIATLVRKETAGQPT